MVRKLNKSKTNNQNNNSFIDAISICVPAEQKINEKNNEHPELLNFIGVKKSFFDTSGSIKTSDLCVEAAKKLIKNEKIKKDEIDFIVFVSQTRDFLFPSTSCIIQDKLNLKKEIICLDIPFGCSGYLYGLYISLLISNNIKKNGMLLSGDMSSKFINHEDKKLTSLFGDAGSATLIKYNKKKQYKSLFKFGTDGSGFNNLLYDNDGFTKNVSTNLYMNGPKIFEFAIKEIPKQFEELLFLSKLKVTDIDYFVFHQANKFILETLQKKLKIPANKMLYSLEKFGNTNSASIPVTISQNNVNFNNKTLFLCGFGVGLSWSSAIINTSNLKTSKLIRYEK